MSEIQQRKGKDHIRYIRFIAQEMINSGMLARFSQDECLQQALEWHRRRLIENEKTNKEIKT